MTPLPTTRVNIAINLGWLKYVYMMVTCSSDNHRCGGHLHWLSLNSEFYKLISQGCSWLTLIADVCAQELKEVSEMIRASHDNLQPYLEEAVELCAHLQVCHKCHGPSQSTAVGCVGRCHHGHLRHATEQCVTMMTWQMVVAQLLRGRASDSRLRGPGFEAAV